MKSGDAFLRQTDPEYYHLWQNRNEYIFRNSSYGQWNRKRNLVSLQFYIFRITNARLEKFDELDGIIVE